MAEVVGAIKGGAVGGMKEEWLDTQFDGRAESGGIDTSVTAQGDGKLMAAGAYGRSPAD